MKISCWFGSVLQTYLRHGTARVSRITAFTVFQGCLFRNKAVRKASVAFLHPLLRDWRILITFSMDARIVLNIKSSYLRLDLFCSREQLILKIQVILLLCLDCRSKWGRSRTTWFTVSIYSVNLIKKASSWAFIAGYFYFPPPTLPTNPSSRRPLYLACIP